MSDHQARLRAGYKAVDPAVIEDIATMMAQTMDNGRAAGIGLVVARFHKMRGSVTKPVRAKDED